MDEELLRRQLELERELLSRLRGQKLDLETPNPKQWLFLNSQSKETLFSGPNQCGKSAALKQKAAYHLTGLYPADWTGPRFEHPIRAAIGGETALTTRDLLTDSLLGAAGDRGTGYIPRDTFNEKAITYLRGGVSNQIDKFKVRHHTNGVYDGDSLCHVFFYSKGWRRLQGYTLHWIGIDEEPDFEVYDELSARTNFTGGYIDISMTPLRGETELYCLFREDKSGERRILHYDIMDAQHLTKDQRDRLIGKYRHHPLASARLHGLPVAGSGIIYQVGDEHLTVKPFKIPDHWPQIIGLDFPHGTGTFAAVKLAIDPDTDVVYVIAAYKEDMRDAGTYASRTIGMGAARVPVAWPHDGGRSNPDSQGGTIAEKYRRMGMKMLHESAHMLTQEGKKSHKTMPVIEEICDRMSDGRFQVFEGLEEWFKEKRRYRHKDGRIESGQEDHLLDATHKAVMMLRYAQPPGRAGAGSFRGKLPEYDFFG